MFNRAFQDGLQLATFATEAYSYATSFPEPTPSSWALVANRGAISTSHMDAGGFATQLKVVLGEKVWFIGVGVPDITADGFDDAKLQWQAVVLKPGDELCDIFYHASI